MAVKRTKREREKKRQTKKERRNRRNERETEEVKLPSPVSRSTQRQRIRMSDGMWERESRYDRRRGQK